VKYAWIQAHRVEFPGRLAHVCRVLGVTRQGYLVRQKRPPSPRAQRKQQRLAQIRTAHEQSRRTYGSPRVFHQLKADQVPICENTVAKYMRETGLSARRPKPFRPQTTDSAHPHPVAPNQLADLKAGLALEALDQALQRRRPASGAWRDQGLLFHSDRGVQYASGVFRTVLEAHGIQRSMSRTGNCYDNAVAESFFATLKREMVNGQTFVSRDDARQTVFEWIEVFYNRQRRHSALGYVSPEQFELQYAACAA
jgi:transposase InsO family protein